MFAKFKNHCASFDKARLVLLITSGCICIQILQTRLESALAIQQDDARKRQEQTQKELKVILDRFTMHEFSECACYLQHFCLEPMEVTLCIFYMMFIGSSFGTDYCGSSYHLVVSQLLCLH